VASPIPLLPPVTNAIVSFNLGMRFSSPVSQKPADPVVRRTASAAAEGSKQ
jgi:hypothetical protein